jgi:hypothetical protein
MPQKERQDHHWSRLQTQFASAGLTNAASAQSWQYSWYPAKAKQGIAHKAKRF